MEAADHLIPVSVLHSRLEKHREELKAERDALPFWQWRRRIKLDGAIGAYAYEIEQLLEHSSKWQPFWGYLSAPCRPDQRKSK